MSSSKISRRAFIKGGLAAAGALAAGELSTSLPAAASSEARLATLIDISRCVGCGACVEACREANEAKFPDPKKPYPRMYPDRVKVEDWSDKRDVDNRLTPYNWLFIQHATVSVEGKETTLTIPRRCMHCVNPPCVKLCPWGAARQLENGLSLIDADLCLGGAKCKAVCPWKIPQRQTGVGLYLDILPAFAGNGVMYKCDRCHDRLARGEAPACIEACPESVQTIGPREEILRKARELAEKIGGYIYGDTENGGTNTFYVSPVPFDLLDRAVEKGGGGEALHFKQVESTMGKAENLLAAMVAAPIAGIAAVVGKYYYRTKKKEVEHEAQES